MGFKSDIEIAQETTMKPITGSLQKQVSTQNIWSSTVITRQRLITIC